MNTYDDIIRLHSIITAMREPYDHHGTKVAELAVKLAMALNLLPQEVNLIRVGAALHDIGKLFIRTDLLNAARRLTEAERAEMQTHVSLGWAVVHEAGYDSTVCEIVRHHHEHYDRMGYPDGLGGEMIPQAARIVAICDVYEALTNQRPYRDAFSHNFAMAHIQKDKGRIFDPKMVDVFFSQVTHG